MIRLTMLGICAVSPATLAFADTGPLVRGEALAIERCARCHSIGQVGDSPFAGAAPFRVIVTRYPPRYLEEALAEGIVTGHAEMPEYVFDPHEIEDFILYLESLIAREVP